MPTFIICSDSEYDLTAQQVSSWRRANVYPHLKANGHTVRELAGNLSNRMYVERELVKPGVTFYSASGHGLFHEFQGSDGNAVLAKNDYVPGEVVKKIIHLLSCNTAFELGTNLIEQGCLAFFGYDAPFTYVIEQMDAFMDPDSVLDKELSSGKNAAAAWQAMMASYDQQIEVLMRAGKVALVGYLMTNRNHCCSPVTDQSWGDPDATI